jgi:hypothetical protein
MMVSSTHWLPLAGASTSSAGTPKCEAAFKFLSVSLSSTAVSTLARVSLSVGFVPLNPCFRRRCRSIDSRPVST